MKITYKVQYFHFYARGQTEFCQKLIANLFEKGESPRTKEFADLKTKRQRLDPYLKGLCSITSQYRIYTIETKCIS